ncbi:hypothetical protein Dimus_020353, partial [Dionaea muscipula]
LEGQQATHLRSPAAAMMQSHLKSGSDSADASCRAAQQSTKQAHKAGSSIINYNNSHVNPKQSQQIYFISSSHKFNNATPAAIQYTREDRKINTAVA